MVDPSAESVATPSKAKKTCPRTLPFSVLTYRCLFYFSTEDMIHQLRTIAQTENRDAKFK